MSKCVRIRQIYYCFEIQHFMHGTLVATDNSTGIRQFKMLPPGRSLSSWVNENELRNQAVAGPRSKRGGQMKLIRWLLLLLGIIWLHGCSLFHHDQVTEAVRELTTLVETIELHPAQDPSPPSSA